MELAHTTMDPTDLNTRLESFFVEAQKPVISHRALAEEAARLVGPLLPCWRALARVAADAYHVDAVHETSAYMDVHGNAKMSATDVRDGCHAMFFVYSARHEGSNSPLWYAPRYAGVCFAVHSLFPRLAYAAWRPRRFDEEHAFSMSRAREAFERAHLTVDESLIDAVVTDGVSNQDWSLVVRVASEWMTVWRAYRSCTLTRETGLLRDVADIVVEYI